MNSEKSVQSIKLNSLFPSDSDINLLEDVSLSETDIIEGDKFLSACKNGDTEYVKKCLDVFNTSVLNKIDPGKYDYTGLHWACENNHIDIVKVLTKHQSININVKSSGGYSALNWCIGNEDVARVLLESGKLNIPEMQGVTNFAKNEDESFQFNYRGRLIQMNSSTSLQSITRA